MESLLVSVSKCVQSILGKIFCRIIPINNTGEVPVYFFGHFTIIIQLLFTLITAVLTLGRGYQLLHDLGVVSVRLTKNNGHQSNRLTFSA